MQKFLKKKGLQLIYEGLLCCKLYFVNLCVFTRLHAVADFDAQRTENPGGEGYAFC